MRRLLKVLQPGFQTTIQDLGRPGYAQFGVSASGAADPVSLRIGNLLVGNHENAPALEMTLVGGEFQFDSTAVIAVTGSDFEPKIDDEPLPQWTSVSIHAGQIVKLRGTKNGARCYLAIQGGISIPTVLGSASTHLLTSLGGHHGRPLQKGDALEISAVSDKSFHPKTFNSRLLEKFAGSGSFRVTDGPQLESFSTESRILFSRSVYEVTEESNRMGIRLRGPSLTRTEDQDILTEGVSNGAIQVSHDGLPIILFVEHQTTGGYPKIANVISADLHRVGQLRPRDKVRFEFTSLQKARELFLELDSIVTQQLTFKT